MVTPKKTAPKAAPKSAAKPAPAKAPAKAASPAKPSPAAKPAASAPASKPFGGAGKQQAPPTVRPTAGGKPVSKVGAGKPAPASDDGGEPVRVPMQKMEKLAGRDTLCQIEIVKDGHVFIARTETDAGTKEYKNTVFEDLLTEMLITLQEQMADH